MNIKLRLSSIKDVCFFVIAALFMSFIITSMSWAQSYENYKNKPKHQVKCFVSIAGDKKALYFAPETQFNKFQLTTKLVGSQMYVSELHAKRNIVAVHECTDFNQNFINEEAQKLQKDADF